MGLTLELKIPEDMMELANKEFEKNWQSNKVVIKRFVYGDILEIQQQSMKVKTQIGSGNGTNADINISEVQIATIMKSVVESPWGKNDTRAIREIPPFIGNWIYEEIEKFNTLEFKKKL